MSGKIKGLGAIYYISELKKVAHIGRRQRERLYDKTLGKVVAKMSLEQQVAFSKGGNASICNLNPLCS